MDQPTADLIAGLLSDSAEHATDAGNAWPSDGSLAGAQMFAIELARNARDLLDRAITAYERATETP